MALTIGSGTFTNGSTSVTGVTFTSGGASFISSGTLLGVGVSPMDRQVEAISATTSTITLREAWGGTTGSKQFTAAYTTEGLRDAVDAARGFSEQLAARSTATTTDMQTATNDVKIATPLKVKQAIDFNTGSAATRDVGESAGNLVEVGAFGVGAAKFYDTAQDFNSFTTSGEYAFTAVSNPNAPTINRFYLKVISYEGGQAVQTATSIVATNLQETYTRWFDSISTWTPWVKTYHTGNILGTVSQSGGVPTGAIIESGSNVNGEYTKYADGTLLISIRTARTLGVSTAYGNLYRTSGFNVDLPTQIIPERTTVSGSFYDANGNSGWILSSINNTTTQLNSLIAVGADNTASAARILDISIMSKWY